MPFGEPFSWKDVGSEIALDEGMEAELRWSQNVDEYEIQVLRTMQRPDEKRS